VYHELSEPQKMLAAIKAALKPDGRLVLLEYRKEDPAVPIRFEHKMSIAEAKLELESEGFSLDTVDARLPRQHILVFVEIAHACAETGQSSEPAKAKPLKKASFRRACVLR
jgi:hypothetical protein